MKTTLYKALQASTHTAMDGYDLDDMCPVSFRWPAFLDPNDYRNVVHINVDLTQHGGGEFDFVDHEIEINVFGGAWVVDDEANEHQFTFLVLKPMTEADL